MPVQSLSTERLFVISDLHLGGRPSQRSPDGEATLGTSLCASYDELRDFIDWVRCSASDTERTTMIIAGDIVDFLADDEIEGAKSYAQSWTDSEERAIAKLNQIVLRSRGAHGDGPFEALQRLVYAGHRLVLLLGNHDVELALPAVRTRLRHLLDPNDQARLEFIYDGEAYINGNLLVEHGNRYDRFNQIDHSQLRQERSMASRGLGGKLERSDRYFQPPPGTLLVIHVINRLKSKYRFVDLLKPETEAVIPLLLFLEPEIKLVLEHILVLSQVAKGVAAGGVSDDNLTTRRTGHLSSAGGDRRPPESELRTLDSVLIEQLGAQHAAELLPATTVTGNMSSGGRNRSLIATRAGARLDAWISDIFKATARIGPRVRAVPTNRLQLLRRVLTCAMSSHAFDLGREADDYLSAATALTRSGRFSTVIFGHTHLPKKIRLDGGKSFPVYLNSGTWADIIRIPPAIFDEEDWRSPLEQFVESLRTNDYSSYVTKCPTYVEVKIVDARVQEAEVRRFGGAGSEREPVYD
ncbi:hypothetical protein LMG28727_02938 [Paraburkholderia kirstenboschensis]|uniref:metallophosphoesterase n=1 Tax=Paraburkholderia kirstenboschensis TaxID=1245436 RepID=UPI000A7DAC9C|nr:metallophosphoesterase [Paraburkholderia kirstenboschensis]CAD6532451.1 hypothetical protein LMG28727_02938 [Paraburkholderia kirstenboschensis]